MAETGFLGAAAGRKRDPATNTGTEHTGTKVNEKVEDMPSQLGTDTIEIVSPRTQAQVQITTIEPVPCPWVCITHVFLPVPA